MASRVALIGAGMSVFGTRPETPSELFASAFGECLGSVDKGLERGKIEEAFVGNLGVGGWQLGNLGPFVAEAAGLPQIPVHRVENACASSGFALREAVRAVQSGSVDIALAAGIEKMNDLSKTHQRYWLGVSGDTEWERMAGLTFAGVYAQMARRHMAEYGTSAEQLASVAVKNHANGALNPKAQFQKVITVEDALRSPMVASPLRLYDCCATTDGAAAVLVASAEIARKLTDAPVWIKGSGAASDRVGAFERASMSRIDATSRAASEALGAAKSNVKSLDLLEVHDCFTIAEIMALEDLGLCPKGKGGSLAASGQTARDGDHPVNPSGGLKSKGHPLGATGAAQAVEIFLQLRGEAGKRQVKDAKSALAHNVGGSGASCVVHVFSR